MVLVMQGALGNGGGVDIGIYGVEGWCIKLLGEDVRMGVDKVGGLYGGPSCTEAWSQETFPSRSPTSYHAIRDMGGRV